MFRFVTADILSVGLFHVPVCISNGRIYSPTEFNNDHLTYLARIKRQQTVKRNNNQSICQSIDQICIAPLQNIDGGA